MSVVQKGDVLNDNGSVNSALVVKKIKDARDRSTSKKRKLVTPAEDDKTGRSGQKMQKVSLTVYICCDVCLK